MSSLYTLYPIIIIFTLIVFTISYKSIIKAYKKEKEMQKHRARLEDYLKIIEDNRNLYGEEDEDLIKYEKAIYQLYCNGKIKRQCEKIEDHLPKSEIRYYYIFYLVILIGINIEFVMLIQYSTSMFASIMLYIVSIVWFIIYYMLGIQYLFNDINKETYKNKRTTITLIYVLTSINIIYVMLN